MTPICLGVWLERSDHLEDHDEQDDPYQDPDPLRCSHARIVSPGGIPKPDLGPLTQAGLGRVECPGCRREKDIKLANHFHRGAQLG